MSSTLQFLLLLGIVILAAKAAANLSSRLGQPAVLGELLAGIILGPSLINIFGLPFVTDAHSLDNTFKELAELGVIFLMFMAGLETDLGEMRKVGKVAVFSGVSGVIFPVAMGFIGALLFGFNPEKALFIGFIMAATSAGISVQTLRELGVLKKREGVALLGAAILDDVLVVLLLAFFLAFVSSGDGAGAAEILLIIGRMVAFFAVTFFLGIKVLPWLLARIKALPVNETLTAFVLGLLLLVAWAAQYLGGVATIVGAFLVGALVGQTAFKHELAEKFNVINSAFFVPIFFVSIGLILDVKALDPTSWLLAGVVTILAIVSKIIGGGLGGSLGGFNNLSSLRLGLGMVSRGDVGLIVALIGINEGIIDTQVYAAAVLMVLVTTLFTPIALKIAFRGETDTQEPLPITGQTGEA